MSKSLRFAIRLTTTATFLLMVQAAVLAQEAGECASAENENPAAPKTALRLLREEGNRYLQDSLALLKAPASWSSSDWLTLGAVGVGVGTAMVFDERLAQEIEERRSSSTNSLSRATTRFGSADAFYISGALVVSGIVFKNENVSSMGREAIEASVFTGIIVGVSKTVFGRERPVAANDETVFRPFSSSNQSFPSGHTTEAFTVASVVAARSSGWLIPTLAYAGASIVAFDRVNDRAHFPSDVIAGAALGIAVGRFVVHRHMPEQPKARVAEVSVIPINHGAGVIVRF